MKTLSRLGAALALGLLPLVAFGQTATAQYYKGKTITVLIGFPAGGGIDRMARVFTEKLTDVVPGNPTVVVKTMPGAGGNKALNFAYAKGDKDGTFMWFGPVQFHAQILGSKSVRYDLSKFHILAAMRGAPVVMYGRTDVVPGGLKMSEDIVKGQGLKFAGLTPSSNLDLHGRPSLDLLGLGYQYVPGYRGGAKARLAVRSGEANLNVTGLANYRGNLSAQVKDGSAKGLWYYPFLDAKGNPVKLASVPEMPHFLEVYEKVKGGQPSGPAWEVLKTLLEFRSIATHMALMPPGTDKQAVDAMRAGFAKILASDDVKAQQQKVLQFTVEPVPVSVAEQRIADLSSFDPKRLATLKSYIQTGRKK